MSVSVVFEVGMIGMFLLFFVGCFWFMEEVRVLVVFMVGFMGVFLNC